MGFKDFFSRQKPEPVNIVVQPQLMTSVDQIGLKNNKQEFGLIPTDYSLPIQSINKTQNGYLYGINGLFPQELNMLYHRVPLHGAILDLKKLFTVGMGYTIEGIEALNTNQKITLSQLTNRIDEYLEEIAQDYFIHSRVYLEVKWNDNYTKIIDLERIAPEKIRINDVNHKMEPINFLYNWDWQFYTHYPTKEYCAFSSFNTNTSAREQLYQYQVKSPGQKLYSAPTYESCQNWCVLDVEMSEYHKANILNSLNPSLLVQYYQKPATKEEKQDILSDLVNSFGGARKTGRAFITFSNGKDLAPTITQMEPNKLDKTFLSLTDTIQRQICYAHRIDPMLLGLKTPGSLGNDGDFIYSWNVFHQGTIKPAQKAIETILNKFIAINGLGVKLKLNETNFVNTTNSPTK